MEVNEVTSHLEAVWCKASTENLFNTKSLNQELSLEELKRTLFEQLRGKTPWMDGFVVEFYQLNRESIREDLLKAVNTLAIIAEFTIEVESNPESY